MPYQPKGEILSIPHVKPAERTTHDAKHPDTTPYPLLRKMAEATSGARG